MLKAFTKWVFYEIFYVSKIVDTMSLNLSELGFTEKEEKIYLALLALGSGTVIEIAKESGIKRTTVYNLLPLLVQKGFVQTAISKGKSIYFVEDVRSLERPVQEHLNRIHELIPELEALHNILPTKPKIRFYEGDGGVMDFFQDTLDSVPAGGIIYEMIGPKAFYENLPKRFAEEYVPRRIKKRIAIKIIATPSGTARGMDRRAKEELREIRFIDSLDFEAGLLIYGKKVGLISLKGSFVGVTIESESICMMMKTAFGMLWKGVENKKW